MQSSSQVETEPGFENKIRWAVSGYPLILNSKPVSPEMTAKNVSDYRHMWRLPSLKKSLVQHFAKISDLGDDIKDSGEKMKYSGNKVRYAQDKIEFYFGFEMIQEDERLVPATLGDPITMPINLAMGTNRLQTICKVCLIGEEALRNSCIFDKQRNQLKLNPDELLQDFCEYGYHLKDAKDRVENPGDFFIDKGQGEITVKLLPAIYPQN